MKKAKKSWNDRPYCVRHYRGYPRNPSTRHAWTRTARDGNCEHLECRYCGLYRLVPMLARKEGED